MRWPFRAVTILVIVGLSVGSTLLWSELAKGVPSPVPLTSGMTGDWTTITKRFDTRVQHRFPIGSSEFDMGRVLSEQGFSQADWGGATGTEHEAVRREDSFVCKVAARIRWRASADGRLTSIRGSYGEEGCL